MKQLTLIRHAKSSMSLNLTDRERPLSEEGIKAAFLIAEWLKTRGQHYDAFFSSSAKRACQTCDIVRIVLDFPLKKTIIVDDLYDFNGSKVQEFVGNLEKDLDSVILFGHNPAFTILADFWGNSSIDNLPTCGVVGITFQETSWETIKKGQTDFFTTPKTLSVHE